MKLKLAQMWDHNGTNMEAIGFMYRTYKVLIALDENQDMSGVAPRFLILHEVAPTFFCCQTTSHVSCRTQSFFLHLSSS